MKTMLGLVLAAGLALGGAAAANAAPFAAAAPRTAEAGASLNKALTTQVGWGHHRRHYRHVHYGYRRHYRPVYHRPVHFHRPVYHRPVYYSRPVYYRPVRYRPAYYGGYGYGPRCVVRYRTARTWDGYLMRRPVRICRW